MGCVALARVLVETMVRSISRVSGGDVSDIDARFDRLLESATVSVLVHPDLSNRLRLWWSDGRGYLHLRPTVAGDRRILQALAERGVTLLRGLGGVVSERSELVELQVEDREPIVES